LSDGVLIIGGGLAGLSSSWHLGRGSVLLEASEEVGGLCRSYRRGDYTFDVSGHLLHFRRPVIRRLVGSILPRQLRRHQRRAFISFRRKLIDYPFQAHLSQLPEKVRRECLEGFLEADGRKSWGSRLPPEDFGAWLRYHFGAGIARHFLEPYNRKMWQVPLEELVPEWAEWAVPVPTVEQVRAAADRGADRSLGYNPLFYYPRAGGIGSLARAMAREVTGLHLGQKVVEVDLRRRRVRTREGRTFYFERLISTVPLPELLRMTKGISPSTVEAGEKLRHVSVCVFNVGLSRPGPAEPHWIYFPDGKVPFYRVGFTLNFSPSSGPTSSTSLYVEVSRRPGDPGCRRLWGEVRAGLEKVGLMKEGEKPAVVDVIQIPYAYVLYDRWRFRVLPGIFEQLESRGVSSLGRYGAWEYSTMEDALLQGREAARRLRRRR
jgi:protoporphyrinogen oxidase